MLLEKIGINKLFNQNEVFLFYYGKRKSHNLFMLLNNFKK